MLSADARAVSDRQAMRRKIADDTPWTHFTIGVENSRNRKKKRHRGNEAKVHSRTGYGCEVLDVAWAQFLDLGHVDDLRLQKGEDNLKAMFFIVYMVIHLGLTDDNVDLIYTPQTGQMTRSTYRRRVIPVMLRMSQHLSLIRWEDRLEKNNHVFHFPKVCLFYL